MKNILRYSRLIILLFLVFASCKKEEKPLFDQKPQERMDETLTRLDEVLNSGNGWVAYIYTELYDEGYSFYMDFLGNNRVQMLSDIDQATAGTAKESSYRVKWLQQPSLLFDTYNYIHRLSDPMPDNQGGSAGVGGEAGAGLISDFEFGLTAATIDSLKNSTQQLSELVTIGRNNSLRVVFYKASAEEAAFWKEGKMVAFMNDVTAYLGSLQVAGVEPEDGKLMQINFGYKNLTFNWLEGDSLITKTSAYAYGADKIVLKDTVSFDHNSFSVFVWKGDKLYARFAANDVLVKDLGQPVIPLHMLISKGAVNKISVPRVSTFPGWSPDFTARREQVLTLLAGGNYSFSLGAIDFAFTSSSDLTISVGAYQGASNFAGTFTYTYTKSDDGIFKFTYQGAGGYASYFAPGATDPVLKERIDTDTFVTGYVMDPAYGLLAKFTSIEHPDFSFTGMIE